MENQEENYRDPETVCSLTAYLMDVCNANDPAVVVNSLINTVVTVCRSLDKAGGAEDDGVAIGCVLHAIRDTYEKVRAIEGAPQLPDIKPE